MGDHGREPAACPPLVIRGQDSQNGLTGVGLHWFRGSFHVTKWGDVFTYLTELFGEPEHSDWALWHYDACMSWPNGVMVRYHSHECRYELTADRFSLECPGEAVAAMEPADLIAFLEKWAYEFDIRVSRIDERLLDYEWIITPLQLDQLVHEIDPETGEVTKRDFAGLNSYSNAFPTDGKQLTRAEVQFGKRGSKGSGSYLRCYDKELESAGEIRAVCWELESSGEKARKRFDDILEAVRWARSEHEDEVAAMAKTIGQHIGGAIDFIDRSAGDKNLARCPRLDFWTKILAKLGGRLTWVTEHVQKTVDRAKSYIYNQVVPSLAMLHEALTPERFWSWLEKTTLDGLDRLRAVHHRAIAAYKVDEAAGLAYTGDMLPMFDAFWRENAPPPLTPEELDRFCR